jgi:hypothetical protein
MNLTRKKLSLCLAKKQPGTVFFAIYLDIKLDMINDR